MHRLYCDGGCNNKTGHGGWGVRLELNGGGVHEDWGDSPYPATNNTSELMAMIKAFELLHKHAPGEPGTVFCDSQYVVNGLKQWIRNWKRRNWRTFDGSPVKNRELWEELDRVHRRHLSLMEPPDILLIQWVRGHADTPGNNRCDELATQGVNLSRQLNV